MTGVNFKWNFFGGMTAVTLGYGWVEVITKFAPMYMVIYGASKFVLLLIVVIEKAYSHHVPTKDESLDEKTNNQDVITPRRITF